MRTKISILFFILFANTAFSQQEAMFTHYMFNNQTVNPASLGQLKCFNATLLHRSQWVGFEGAPVTQSFTFGLPIKSKNLALGMSAINDRVGYVSKTFFYIDISYKIKLYNKTWLSFGLKSGVDHNFTDLASVNTATLNDPDFVGNVTGAWLPNFGSGVYLFSDKYFVGVSTPKILENNFFTNSISLLGTTNQRHYYIIGGLNSRLNRHVSLKTSAYLKYTRTAPMQLDLSAILTFSKKVWLGSMYRLGDAVGLLLGVNINQNFSVGYAYDWSYSNTTFKYNIGSHEVFLKYKFRRNKVCPAYDIDLGGRAPIKSSKIK